MGFFIYKMSSSKCAFYEERERRERLERLRALEEFVARSTPSAAEDLAARICIVAQRAKADGFDDVAAWMQRYLAMDIRVSRRPRKRGIHVRIGSVRGPKAFLDAERVRELTDC